MPSLFVALQKIVPQHLLSRIVGRVAESGRFKKPFINWFAARYGVDMSEAQEQDLLAYDNFNAFFTRALKPRREAARRRHRWRACRFFALPMAQ